MLNELEKRFVYPSLFDSVHKGGTITFSVIAGMYEMPKATVEIKGNLLAVALNFSSSLEKYVRDERRLTELTITFCTKSGDEYALRVLKGVAGTAVSQLETHVSLEDNSLLTRVIPSLMFCSVSLAKYWGFRIAGYSARSYQKRCRFLVWGECHHHRLIPLVEVEGGFTL